MTSPAARRATAWSIGQHLARWPAAVWPVVCAVAGFGVAVVLFAVDPNQPGRYPPCPLFWLTGTYCPGCGALRGLHALTHLDVVGVARMNPALLVAVPYLIGSWAAWLRRGLTGARRRWLAPPAVLWIVFGLIVFYWVVRNVPALAPWLAPGGVIAPAFAG